MSAVKGLLSTNEAATNELVGEYQTTIFVRNSRGYNVGTTLFGLMSRLDNEPADNLEYNWFEREPVRKTIYANAAGLANATSLTFDDGAGGDVGQLLPAGTILLHDASGEHIQVGTTPTTTTVSNGVTVVRAVGAHEQSETGAHNIDETASAITDNDTFTILTYGNAEGADPVQAAYENPLTCTNFIQTFNSTVELTNAFKNSVLRTDIEGPLTDRRIQALEKVCRDIEFAFFLGAKYKKAVAGHGFRYYTGGIYNAIVEAGLSTTNILNGQADDIDAVTGGTQAGCFLSSFNTWLQNVLPFGSDVKLAFCGPTAYSTISTFANSESNGYRIMQNETVYGMHIQTINTPFGELSLCQHPLFREAVGLRDYMFIVELPHLTQKVFEKLFP